MQSLDLARRGSTVHQAEVHQAEVRPAEAAPSEPIRGLAGLIAVLDRHEERVPLTVLDDALRRLVLRRGDLSAFTFFDCDCYKRNRIHTGRGYELLLLCWQDGQRSPVHDHRGSSCAFRVVQGEGVERCYRLLDDGALVPTEQRVLPEGFVCASAEADIHEVANLGDGPLMTLHVYSPELTGMVRYERERIRPGS